MASVGMDMHSLFEAVPDDRVVAVVRSAAGLFDIETGKDPTFDADVVATLLISRIARAVTLSGLNLVDNFRAEMSKRASYDQARAATQAVTAVLESLKERGTPRDSSSDTGEASGSVITGALERLSGTRSAAALSRALALMQSAASEASTLAGAESLSAQLRHLEVDPEVGADLAILIHQLKMVEPAGASALSGNARALHTRLREMHTRVRQARLRFCEHIIRLPVGVDLQKLLDAVSSGSLDVTVIVGKGSTARDREYALMVAWPGLIEIVAEVHPRDLDARRALLRIGRAAFEPGANAIAVIEKVFKDYS